MRIAAVVLALLLALPAAAADWGRYENARYGYGIDVPPGFAGQGESDNGDGQVFSTPTAKLTVYGANVVTGDFEDEVRQSQKYITDDGWTLTYQVSTPNKASYSGVLGARVIYVRMIALCASAQFAAFSLEYSKADLAKFDPVVSHLVQSLTGGGNC